MTTKEEIGLGFAGLGWPGYQHATAARTLPGVVAAAACDLGGERREKFAAEFSPRRSYEQYDDLLADPAVDAVVISLPNFLHHSATIAALRAGKHVLCEKPPAMNVAEIEAIRREVRARGLVYAFSRQSRFSNRMLAARRLVEDGALGTVYFAKAKWVRSRGIPSGTGGWFLEKEKAGGGALIDIGIHALDAAWYLAGCPRPVSVFGQVTQHFRHTLPAGVRYDTDDGAYAAIRFEGGLMVHLETSWAANLTDAVPASSWTGHELIDTILYGNQATLRLNPLTLFTMDGMERRDTALTTGPENPGFELQMDDFLAAIRTGTPPVNNVDQAVSLMKMLMAIYDSSAAGTEIRLID